MPKRFLILALLTVAVLGVGVGFGHDAFAQVEGTGVDLEAFAQQAGFSTTATIPVIIARLIRSFLVLLGIILLVLVLYGGFVWMTAGGNAERVEKAKKILINAVIGLVIILSSFAITQFVLGALEEAVGGGITDDDDGGGGYNDGDGPGDQFVLLSINTDCAVIRNMELQLVFSKDVRSSTVEEGILVQDADGMAVEGTFSVRGETVVFIPAAPCEENTSYTCFEADADYTVSLVAGTLEAEGGAELSCTIDYPCSYDFHTGTALDTAAPTAFAVDAPEDGASIIVNTIEKVWVATMDDVGISTVDFLVDSDSVQVAGLSNSTAGELSPTNSFFTDDTQWDTAGYVTNQSYDIWAEGSDCAGNDARAARIEVIVRAANCGNGVQDEDLGETDVDCGGDSDSEYYCGLCDGDACTDDAQCGNGTCEDGVCVTVPEISDVSPNDGAEENLVTIQGSGFGATEGTVTFLGTEAGDQQTVGAYQCAGLVQWSDEEIIVQVPDGAVDGPLSVTTSEGDVERTDDEQGPAIGDFDVNAIRRPGICSVIDPDTGTNTTTGNSDVEITGIRLGDAQGSSTVYFTTYEADDYLSWADELISAVVPLLNGGTYRTQVFTGDYLCLESDGTPTDTVCASDADCTGDGQTCATGICSETGGYCLSDDDCPEGAGTCESLRQGSNKVSLSVTSVSEGEAPIINFTDSGWTTCDDGTRCAEDADCTDGSSCSDAANWGPPGQYVTMYGSGFGSATGSVYLVSQADDALSALGSADFPESCSEDHWHDDEVTIKLPDAYTNEDDVVAGAHSLYIVRSEDGAVSNVIDFQLVDDVPGPSICSIDPSAGPEGTAVEIAGDNFGNEDGTVTFYDAVDADPTATIWANQSVGTEVPDGAVTGPVEVSDASGFGSNSVNFTVGDCHEDTAICSEGTSCCADGTCRVTCESDTREAHYAYLFSTADIPETPRVVVQCGDWDGDGNNDGVSPSPWEGWSEPEDICLNVIVTATFSVVMDESTLTTDNIAVQACIGTGEVPCEVLDASLAGSVITTPYGFIWEPADAFSSSTIYQVTLNGGEEAGAIQSADLAYMEEDYSWRFETSSSTDLCEIGEVAVNPSEYTATEENERVNYLAYPTAANDRCVALSCDGYTWTWESDQDGAVLDSTTVVDSCVNVVTAEAETNPGDPALIEATVDTVGSPSDTGEITIDFIDPEVTGYQPNCDSACVNASILVTFNTRMDPATMTSSYVALYQCEDATCADHLTEVSLSNGDVLYSEADPSAPMLVIDPPSDLQADTHYRILISGNALSASGVPLSTVPSDCTETGDTCAFKTSDSAEICDIDHLDLDPPAAAMSYVGERQEFLALAYGQPDDCSPLGQVLDPGAYVWSSWDADDEPDTTAAADVAFMLPSPSQEGQLELTETLPAGCSSSCLNVGSAIGAGDAVCGDGSIGVGEDCDDGGTSDGDGCSSICLREGANGSYGTCGNGAVEQGSRGEGEDCDGGEACSDACLNEGTSKLSDTFAECGDGTVDWSSTTGGEDCDDGNDENFDGCSHECLHEGSIPESEAYSTCGDRAVEAGEDCDDGNTADGDGCSSICLNESGECEPDTDEGCTTGGLWAGSSPYYETASFCGDGNIGTGEECDATDLSEAAVGPYGVAEVDDGVSQEVGDDGFAYSVVSVEADGVTGSADLSVECSCASDAACGAPDTLGCGTGSCCFPRPRQTTANPASGATDVCLNTSVWAQFDQVMDIESFDLSQDTDGDGAIETGEYDPEMYLQLVRLNGATVETDCPSEAEAAGYAETVVFHNGLPEPVSRNVFARAWHWVSGGIARLFGREARAHQQTGTNICLVPVRYTMEEMPGSGSRIHMLYDGVLLANAQYHVHMEGDSNTSDSTAIGVLSKDGVGVDITLRRVTSFTTGTEICALEYVDTQDLGRVESFADETEDPSIGLFTEIGEEHFLQATAYTIRSGAELEEIAETSDYAWEYSWGSSVDDASEDDVVAVNETVDDTRATVVASGANGDEVAIAVATITTDNFNDPDTEGDAVTGETSLKALLCEHPWPEPSDYPYEETTLNFSTYYCRDAGEPGTADDLPPVTAVEVPTPLSGIYKEYLYQVEGTGDALGLRVITNEDYLPPDLWYFEQGFTGSYQATDVDGYEAIRDGNTYYILNANQTGAIFPNITVISYNESASDESLQIFEQMIANWQFNSNDDVVTDINLCTDGTGYVTDAADEFVSCRWDGDCVETCVEGTCSATGSACQTDTDCALDDTYAITCDAEKAKLVRDTRRLSDLVRLKEYMDSYGEANGHCSLTTDQSCDVDGDCPGTETCEAGVPQLVAGSFLRGLSLSAWPSWSATLGNELGIALPEDPLNAFLHCPEGFDGDSCYNGNDSTFICPEGSHVYVYQAQGLEQYKLYAPLEYDQAPWEYAIDMDNADNAEVHAEYVNYSGSGPLQGGFDATALFCDGGTHGESSFCGDGLIGAGEDCELGDYFTQPCTDDEGNPGVQTYACTSDCQNDPANTELGECIPYSCGNGVVEEENGEECDDGDLNGTYGHCGEDCQLSGTFSCGDGYLAGGEACDCGNTADFDDIIEDPDSWAAVNSCAAPNGQYSQDPEESCAFDCSFPGPSCGDEEINGNEECDGGYEEWDGALCRDETPCSTDSDCRDGSACGDGKPACGTGAICIGGGDEGRNCDDAGSNRDGDGVDEDTDCGSGSCSDFVYELSRTRTCNDTGSNACTWRRWSICVGGDQYCGNGVVEGTETCDDGNDSNNDACLTSCVLNVCGDDYVNTGVESCDAGEENGEECIPDYGGTCNFCSITCQYQTASGAYCGDGVRDDGEACDGTDISYYYFDTQQNDDVRHLQKACDRSEYGTIESLDAIEDDEVRTYQFTCRYVGLCNGGDDNGEPCTINPDTGSELTEGVDAAGCAGAGVCVPPTCASDCSSSCPFSLQTASVLVQSEEAGTNAEESVDLYSYLSGESPDNAVIFIPECTVGTKLTADVSLDNVIPPSVAVVFVIDTTNSMEMSVDGTEEHPGVGNRRIDYASEGARAGIEELFDTYVGSGGDMKIALLRYSGPDDRNEIRPFSPGYYIDYPYNTSDLNSALLEDDTELQGVLDDYVNGTCDPETTDTNNDGLVDGCLLMWTPTYLGVNGAKNILEASDAEVKIVVLLSDGNITHDGTWHACGPNYDEQQGEPEPDRDSVEDCVEDIAELVDDNPDKQFYTIAIGKESTSAVGFIAHMSSSDCGTDWGDFDDCQPEDNVTYHYSAETAEEILEVYDTIMDQILGTTFTFTTEEDGDTVVTSGSVREGAGVTMPFPEGFDCTGSSFTIPFQVSFNGTGQANIGNFQLTNCPVE